MTAEVTSEVRPFAGQVVLITGASRGIGRATALRFATGGADVVVNYLRHRTAAEDTARDVEARGGRALDVKGRALLLCAQRAVPLMEGRWGRIISISSIGSFRVLPNYVGPGVAKSILETLTRYLAVELAPSGISVNAVSGGVIETDALQS